MGNIFFTSDTHFGHKNIIDYCKRPFQTVNEMDEALILNWNSTVGVNDTVYHCGDFGFGSKERLKDIFDRLNGNIVLIQGNHDNDKHLEFIGFKTVFNMKIINVDKKTLHLCHYPIESWAHQTHGSLHIHGHSHGRSLTIPNRVDVGVDCCNYFPVSLDQLQR